MGRRNDSLVQAISSSSPLTRAILKIATVAPVSRAWRTVDDWAMLISHLYKLDDTKAKGELTGRGISEELSKDSAVSGMVDPQSSWMNATGIFRDKYVPRAEQSKRGRVTCLFLAPQGETPPKCSSYWYDGIKHVDNAALREMQSCLDVVSEADRNELVEHLKPAAPTKPAPTPMRESSKTTVAVTPLISIDSNNVNRQDGVQSTPSPDSQHSDDQQKPAAVVEYKKQRGSKRQRDFVSDSPLMKKAKLNSLLQPGTIVDTAKLVQKIGTWTYDHNGDDNVPPDVLQLAVHE